jgi:DNA-binding NarL/FixJ family response regulator
VEDHPLFRLGLARTLREHGGFEVCGEAASASAALDGLRQVVCDAVVLDISLPGGNGIELVKQIVAEHPGLQVLMLSMHPEGEYALQALRAGARGYLAKGSAPESLVAALHEVLEGGVYVSPGFRKQLIYRVVSTETGEANPLDRLTARELEVLRFMGDGCSSKQTAEALQISVKTIESHRLHIKEKLELQHASELVSFAMQWRQHAAAADAAR